MRYLVLLSIIIFIGCAGPEFHKDPAGVLWIQCANENTFARAGILYEIGCRTMGTEPDKRVMKILKEYKKHMVLQ